MIQANLVQPIQYHTKYSISKHKFTNMLPDITRIERAPPSLAVKQKTKDLVGFDHHWLHGTSQKSGDIRSYKAEMVVQKFGVSKTAVVGRKKKVVKTSCAHQSMKKS